MPAFIDHTGQRFGRLVVMGRAENSYNRVMWLCSCDCGKEAQVQGCHLRSGDIVSCGCYRRWRASQQRTNLIHGHAIGGKLTPEYNSWASMLKRCYNPNHKSFADYGGRGVGVCDQFRYDFAAFFAYLGPRAPGTTLDRWPDPSGNYEPGNVRWATPTQQRGNQRRPPLTDAKIKLIRQRIATGIYLVQVANEFGISPQHVRRIKRQAP